MRKTFGDGAILAKKNAVVAARGSQAVGAKAQVGQMVAANAKVGDAKIQFGAGNIMELINMFHF